MKYKWLNNCNNEKLIIFFNGWGMDEGVVEHLEPENYDVLMFYDYNSLETDFNYSEIEKYQEKHLIAWSMGVMIGTLFDIQYKSKTAINGTLKPIDNKFGIPERIYDLTLDSFNIKTAEIFIKNMFKENCQKQKINRDYDNIKSELRALKNYKSNLDFKYDRIIISTKDMIIPTKNQSAFWGISPNTDAGHAPFNNFNKWSELL